ncbi:MAG: hypothetical protein KKE02_19820 [Alphaproteobacteria bacterium]|nr:hypothetical protein [Alphaproteobacteria bacterium]MBU1516637.1 hypothetical protein [Alphaproteobacteria bacterium]MBU2094393.1 hypothetical protein [Alphaproteobacteria bacterium]MBU2153278.1 hypothetical protein [Alphaproteobacteria bacterium]MBU2307564.1 hypothetical protein [Alphaproteobacteria bacterium]
MPPRRWGDLVARANADARQPVLLIAAPETDPAAWGQWVETFEAAGYVVLTPDWRPGEHDHRSMDALAQAAADVAEVARALSSRPAIIGHGVGGLVARTLAADGLSAATVAIASGPASPSDLLESEAPGDPRGLMLMTANGASAFARETAEDALSFIQRFV